LFVEKYDPAAVANVLLQVAATYFGASGRIVLDENGDRVPESYDILAINEESPGEYKWERVAYWSKSQVAVNLIAFEEAAVLMKEATKYPILREDRWFGSDGTAGSGDLKKYPDVAKFCYDTKFLNTIFAPTRSEIFNKVTKN
jgi:hypothetical protein